MFVLHQNNRLKTQSEKLLVEQDSFFLFQPTNLYYDNTTNIIQESINFYFKF